MGDYLRFLERIVPATVNIHAYISHRNASVKVLGHERMGTGSLVTSDGHILTVNYIVLGAKEITITTHDKKEYPAQVVYMDFENGFAVIKAEGSGFPVVPLGYSDELKVSDKILALASTSQHERRVTQGFVTVIKPFDAYWEYMIDDGIMSTAVNPGFGGGPMLNNLGKVMGIVYLNLNSVKEMSMAIPINLFHKAKEDILEHGTIQGRVPRPWIGAYTISTEMGVLVAGMVIDGPAHKAGLQVKDTITEINGVEIEDRRRFYEELWKGEAGAEISITVLRNDTPEPIHILTVDRAVFYGEV